MKKISNLLILALLTIGMGLTSCDEQLDNAVVPYTPGVTPTVEDIIKYGFKVTDLNGVDRTEAVTSLKMSNEDGSEVVEAEVSADHKIAIKNTDLTAASFTAAIDFWFEAEIGGKPYIAKVNIDPTTLNPETPMTLEMATLGDVILSDGKFAARTSTAGNKAMIAYLGSSTGVDGYTHGLALALSDVGMGAWEAAKTYCSTTMNSSTPVTGATWLLASKDQWDNMISACKNVLGTKNNYQDLRDGFSDISDASNLKSDENARYWSSTEFDADATCAWYFNFDSGSWYNNLKEKNYWIRACLAF